MRLADNFEKNINLISDLDREIKIVITLDDIAAEEIQALVDKREQLLRPLITQIEQEPVLATSEQWVAVVKETQIIVELMQNKTANIGQTLAKYRRGSKSVQQYKKYL
ncbi:flagellar protein FliT [Vibrio sinensis]|uniref:Flagellar protein FliT n=1 Tax=Vibrio sinensis TaxID=2302434 RepID=A0A3A6QYE9_9VIBR|nr:flagellar protein FliT [Vibrio sinensis]RJX67499.1 flagellar protein FliT [Vibrio sinensis]